MAGTLRITPEQASGLVARLRGGPPVVSARERRKKQAGLPEHDEQVAVIEWANGLAGRVPELARLFAIPNGGKRSITTAAMLKAEGVRRGVLDLFLPVVRNGVGGLFVEMKRIGGRLSPDQSDWIEYLTGAGYRAVCCQGAASAVLVICEYMGLDPAEVAPQFCGENDARAD